MEEIDHVSHTITNVNRPIHQKYDKKNRWKKWIKWKICLFSQILRSWSTHRHQHRPPGGNCSVFVLNFSFAASSELFERHLAKKITFFFCHFFPEVHHHMAELWPRYESIAVLIFSYQNHGVSKLRKILCLHYQTRWKPLGCRWAQVLGRPLTIFCIVK